MQNGKPMILSTPDSIALRRRMQMLETQIQALLDGMTGVHQALEGLLNGYEDLEDRIARLENDNHGAILSQHHKPKSRGNSTPEVVDG